MLTGTVDNILENRSNSYLSIIAVSRVHSVSELVIACVSNITRFPESEGKVPLLVGGVGGLHQCWAYAICIGLGFQSVLRAVGRIRS